MGVKERIKLFSKEIGITVQDFEKSISVSNGYVNSISKSIGIDKVESILEKYPNINLEWVLIGKGEMLKSEAIVGMKENKKTLNSIPLVNQRVVAGFGSSNFNIKESDVKAFYVIPKFKDRKIDFMIEVSGSSMYPKYNSGDIIACTIIKESRFIQWNKVHVIATIEQGLLVKRIKENGSDEIIAVSDNPDYPPFHIPKNEITGIALVVGVIRLE